MTESHPLEENKAAIAAELADGIVDHPRKLVFVSLIEDGQVLTAMRTTDFPHSDIEAAIREFRQNAKVLVHKSQHAAMQGIDRTATEDNER